MKKILWILVVFLSAQAIVFGWWLYKLQARNGQEAFSGAIIPASHITLVDSIQPPATSYKMQLSEQAMLAALFHQRAAEYRALCHQAFMAARLMLEIDLLDKSVKSPRAIIVDIDETLIDNSPHQAKCIEEATSYPDFWDEWCNLAQAKAVPGAVEFLIHARKFGVSVFYITNRRDHLKEVTMKNLRDLGFPQVEEKNMYFRTTESSKEGRRQEVAKIYHISMFIGDNLADFSYLFDNKTIEQRAAVVDSLSSAFGRRYIVLPNTMYGDWESALYNYDFSLSDSAKLAVRYMMLQSF